MTSIPIDIKNQETLFICYGKLNPKSVVGYKYVILESFFYNPSDIHEFKKNNEIPTHLKEIVQFSCQWSVLQKFLIRTRPDLANYEIRSL